MYWIMNIKHQWRLFTDSWKTRLKAVLLHNGHKFPSAPFAYATKETYENVKTLQYDKYCCLICCDLKATALLMGLQLGYVKFCFLSEWDGGGQDNYIKERPKRE
jgi:hypothetical protein